MSACLPDIENRIICVSAGQLPFSSEQVAAFLLEKMGIEDSDLPDPNKAETADSDWIKTTLFPRFRDLVNEKCSAGIKQWLVIDNIDKEPLPDTGVRRFLDVLYSEIEKIPELRIVLIGLKDKLKGVNASIELDEEVEDPNVEDISRYIRMRYTDSQIDFDYQGGEIKRLAGLVERSASTVIEALDDYVRTKVDDLIDDTVNER
jgi:hypothetical protein